MYKLILVNFLFFYR